MVLDGKMILVDWNLSLYSVVTGSDIMTQSCSFKLSWSWISWIYRFYLQWSLGGASHSDTLANIDLILAGPSCDNKMHMLHSHMLAFWVYVHDVFQNSILSVFPVRGANNSGAHCTYSGTVYLHMHKVTSNIYIGTFILYGIKTFQFDIIHDRKY